MGVSDQWDHDPVERAKQLRTYGKLNRSRQYSHRPTEENILFERVRELRLKFWLTVGALAAQALVPPLLDVLIKKLHLR